jgi:hypothetical protein
MKLLRLLSLYATLALLLGGGIIPYAYRFHCLILLSFLTILYRNRCFGTAFYRFLS